MEYGVQYRGQNQGPALLEITVFYLDKDGNEIDLYDLVSEWVSDTLKINPKSRAPGKTAALGWRVRANGKELAAKRRCSCPCF